MAERFLSLDARERADILQTLAASSGRSAVILEKDIWVCWVLQALFSMPDPHPMAFKGGTSLSKVYGVIDRFSEDVDITLDYRAFDDGFDPFADGASRTQIRRFSEHLRDRVAHYIRDVVAPALDAAAEHLSADGRHDIHIGDGRLRLVPDDDQFPALQSDYNAMRDARILGEEAPGFDALIERIRILEADANRPI